MVMVCILVVVHWDIMLRLLFGKAVDWQPVQDVLCLSLTAQYVTTVINMINVTFLFCLMFIPVLQKKLYQQYDISYIYVTDSCLCQRRPSLSAPASYHVSPSCHALMTASCLIGCAPVTEYVWETCPLFPCSFHSHIITAVFTVASKCNL